MRPQSTSAPVALFRRAYLAIPSQISAVRADLRALLGRCPVGDDVILCVSELAANAAVHSDSRRPGGTLTVHLQVHENEYVRIKVDDDGGEWIQSVVGDGRSHGLDIIQALASRWGAVETTTGRTVWAQIDWPVP